MLLYLAPMEGLTGYVFRNAYNKFYNNIDKYFTPFISHPGLSHRELQDVLPEHNRNMYTVPQILTNKSREFILIAEKLTDMGYKEVNLNLGCPSGTVVKKKRGAGMLADLPMLESFLTEIFEKCTAEISVKTRLGLDSPEEWPLIHEIYEKFPIKELIIHPRVQKDMYKKPVRPAGFAHAYNSCQENIQLCYNGDIMTPDDFKRFRCAFPDTSAVMLGRGILKNPELAAAVRRLSSDTSSVSPRPAASAAPEFITVEGTFMPISDLKRFSDFHRELLEGYMREMNDDVNALFKMKEFWFYAGQSFPDAKKELKTIKKAHGINEYSGAVNSLLGKFSFTPSGLPDALKVLSYPQDRKE